MASGTSSPRSPSPESSTAIADRDQDDARSSSSSSSNSSSSHDSDSSTSIVSHNNQGSARANDDNGDDGVMVSKDSVGGGSSDEVVVSEDAGREDMFLDASEDLGADGRESSTAYTEAEAEAEARDNSDNEQQIQFRGLDTGMQNDYMVDEMERLRAVLDKTINEKDSIARECKDEIEMAAKALAHLRDQIRGLMNDSAGVLGDDTARLDDRFFVPELGDSGQRETHLHEMIHECQRLIGTVSDSRKQDEGVVRQLQDDMSVKNQEICDLDRRVAELTISGEVVDSYVGSLNNVSMELHLQKDHYVDDAANRMLSSLASVVYVEQLMDSSLTGKVAHLEKAVCALLENYNWFLYETDQLRSRLVEVRPDISEQNDYALVFATSRDELLELKKKEVEFVEKLSHRANECSKLTEQLEKHKMDAEAVNAELQKARAELEQEKNRYLNTKEKLSLAVTKGKALVQQRDSLKQTLADKSTILEKCLAEIQEKSLALDSAELIKEELVKSQISTASLQDMLSEKDMLLEKIEEVLLESSAPGELRSMNICNRIRWLVDDRNILKDFSLKFDALVDSLFSVYLPENTPFSSLESQLVCIRESFDQAKTKANTLQGEISRIEKSAQDEIDKLSSSLSIALVEKNCLKVELDRIALKYDEVLRMLQEVSGLELDNDENMTQGVQQCIAKMKERKSSSLESAQVSMETFACMQDLLYVRNQGLVLCEQLLEEEMQEKLELNRVLNDLRKASEEMAVLKEERENLRKDLERSEDKSGLIREKLSMAVKKGKGLVQEKENLKRLIDEKSAEIDELRMELQQKEKTIDDCRNQIVRLSDEVGCIPNLEVDLAALRDQTAQSEKDLAESNKLLQSLMEFIDGIVIPLGSEFEDPIGKVKWLGEYLNNFRVEKGSVEQELEAVKLDAETSASKLVNVSSTVSTLENALSLAENNISQLVEEKTNLEIGKRSLENQLREAVEESLLKASMLTEATSAIAVLESALSQAENSLMVLGREKDESESSIAAAEEELANLKGEVSVLRTRLAESSSSLKLLDESTSELETTIMLLKEEKNAAEASKSNAENELQKLKVEAGSWDHKLQDALEKIKSLEFALEQAEGNLSVLSNEKNTAENEKFTEVMAAKALLESALSQAETTIPVLLKEKEESESCRAAAETELAHLKEEVSDLRTRLAESSRSIMSLEDATTHLETAVSLLTEEKNAADAGKTNAVNELQKLKEEAGSWEDELQDALAKIKSLEFALEQAESNLSVLANEKNAAENEMLTLSAKLNTCMEELSGMNGNLKSQSVELFGYLKDLESLITEEPAFSFLEQFSRKRVEALREMDIMFRNIRIQFAAVHVENLPTTEEVPYISKFLSGDLDNIVSIQYDSDKGETTEIVDVSSCVRRILESYHAKHGNLVQKFDLYSNLEDRLNSAILEEIRGSMDKMIHIIQMADSLKRQTRSLETDKLALENEMATLKNDVTMLESACADATRELEAACGKHILEHNSSPKHHVDIARGVEINKHAMAVEKLLSATREVHIVLSQFQKSESEFSSTIQEMQKELGERRVTEGKAIMELKSNESEMSKLEIDFKMLQDSYNELTHKLEESQTTEVSLGNKEAEISSLRNTLWMKEQEVTAALLWASQVKAILDKANKSEIITEEKEGGSLEVQDSAYIKKLHFIMDNFVDLQHQNEVLYHKNEELQSAADSKLHEIQYLKKLCEKDAKDEHELKRVKSEFYDLVSVVGRVIQKLDGRSFTGDSNFAATRELVETLEKLVMGIIKESDNSKNRVQDLSAELLANQEAVDELLLKVKALEDSLEDRAGPSEGIQERSIFEASSPPPASEISEIEEVATVANPSISPVPSAAHVRTMRKGLSNDHIALDMPSERLITNDMSDGDKGHVFKSLNASGLIPKQGKMVADRVDGIWVSAGRVLMSRPRARLGLIAYWLLLHIWLLGTIL